MTFMCHNYLHSEYKVAIKSGMLCIGQIEKFGQTFFKTWDVIVFRKKKATDDLPSLNIFNLL